MKFSHKFRLPKKNLKNQFRPFILGVKNRVSVGLNKWHGVALKITVVLAWLVFDVRKNEERARLIF
jgi:hypothetical protein